MRTLIVRIADAGPADAGVRGILEEVGQEPVTFRSADDLVDLLRACMERPDRHADPPDPAEPPA